MRLFGEASSGCEDGRYIQTASLEKGIATCRVKAARLLQRNVLVDGKNNFNKFRHFLCKVRIVFK